MEITHKRWIQKSKPKEKVLKALIQTVSLCCLLAVSLSAQGQWENPAEKYLDEHKRHQEATCPIAGDSIKHFIYFARDREAIRKHPLLSSKKFSGAQIMYPWVELEPERDRYDFSSIREDLNHLTKYNKKLFVQLQDATFSPKFKAVPNYLLADAFDGGATPQHDNDGKIEGWVAKRWNPQVQTRFAKLLEALGKEFDAVIEGINLQETAIGLSNQTDPSFTEERYVDSLKKNMLALKKAFPNSTTMQYANFMPGEWLPWDDKGYLKAIYEFGEENGIGLGAPDLMIQRKAQLNHALRMMHEYKYQVPLGIAVQDGNYIGQTGTMKIVNKRQNIVPILHSFAKDFLRVEYIFWANQKPYFRQDVFPCLEH